MASIAMRRTHLCAALLLLSFTQSTVAKPREEQLDLPVKVQNAYGRQIEQSIKVTVFSDDGRALLESQVQALVEAMAAFSAPAAAVHPLAPPAGGMLLPQLAAPWS